MKTAAILCLLSSSLVSNVISFQATTKLSIQRNARCTAPLLVPAFFQSKVKKSSLELNAIRTSDQSLKNFQSNSTVVAVPFSKEEYVVSSQQNPLSIDIDIDNDMVKADTKIIYIMMALMFSVASLSSLDRVAMSVALVPMTEEMGLTDSIKGSISSLYSVGYGLGILPAGLLLAYASPRVVMAAGIALWSVGTIATPFAAGQTGMAFLLGARGLVGASESVVFPSIQRILSNWVPPEKKGLAMAWVFSGFQSGTILAYSLSPLVIDQFGSWRDLFYVYGGAGLLFLIPWLALAKDAPAIPKEEAFEIPNVMEQVAIVEELSPSISPLQRGKDMITAAPWKEFAQSKGVWAMFFAHAANNWGLYNNLSWTPTFYAEQYGLNVKESAILLVVPSIAGMIGGTCIPPSHGLAKKCCLHQMLLVFIRLVF
jgi:MFS family permease